MEICFKWLLSLTVLPRVAFRTQPKVYGGAFLQKIVNSFQLLTVFAKNPHNHKCQTVLPGKKKEANYIISGAFTCYMIL